MNHLRKLAACVLIPLVMAGCATTDGGYDKNTWCVVGGAVAGAAGGGLASSDVGGAAIGALAGAVLGPVICSDGVMPAKDSDGDGVPDDMDDCPGTPPGAPVDDRGCPLDSDGDGVPDYRDQCPNTPAGVEVDQYTGCPKDSDGDGVPDSADQCPNTPQGQRVGADGCPVCDQELAIVTNVNFAFDSSALSADAKSKLARVTEVLRTNPMISVVVEGHTDSIGTEAYNQGLSERRANAVAAYLASEGIDSGRLSTVGKGEGTPLVSNKTSSGRAVNRRVEFRVACPAN